MSLRSDIQYTLESKAYFQQVLLPALIAAITAPLVVIGDRLGLYKVLASVESATLAEIAECSGVNDRFLREWLSSQCAAGFIEYRPADQTYRINNHEALAFADDESSIFVPGAFQIAAALCRSLDKVENAFLTGRGVAWHDQDPMLFEGMDRFIRPGYGNNLVPKWLPALDGMLSRLAAGAIVLDVGCGRGAAIHLMAQAFENSRFLGIDSHEPSILEAQAVTRELGLTNVEFAVADAVDLPGHDYDLITSFDCFHDMGDPAAVARAIYQRLKHDGIWMLVEPYADDSLEKNLGPIGQMFYSISTAVCTQVAHSQNPAGPVLGAQAGLRRLTAVFRDSGFTRIRQVAETPFKMILEVRR